VHRLHRPREEPLPASSRWSRADANQTDRVVRYAAGTSGNFMIARQVAVARGPHGQTGQLFSRTLPVPVRAVWTPVREGDGAAIISMGAMVPGDKIREALQGMRKGSPSSTWPVDGDRTRRRVTGLLNVPSSSRTRTTTENGIARLRVVAFDHGYRGRMAPSASRTTALGRDEES